MSNIGECGLDVGTRHAVPAFWFGDLAVKSLSWSGDHERTRIQGHGMPCRYDSWSSV